MGGCPQNMMGGQFVALPGAFHGAGGRSSGCLFINFKGEFTETEIGDSWGIHHFTHLKWGYNHEKSGTLRILLLHQSAVSTNARLCEFTCVMSQIGIPNCQAKVR